jgi:hypothetical protein
MRYHIKAPGAFLWQPLVTDSLVSELETGRIRRDWKIRRENESDEYTVDQLCQQESTEPEPRPAPKAGTAEVPAKKSAPKYGTFAFLALYLVLALLWRGFTTANEYDSVPVVTMTIAFDVLCVIALVAVRIQIKRALPDNPLPDAAQLLFVVALLAGVGLLVIRFTSDASWWTGHLHYDCCPPR